MTGTCATSADKTRRHEWNDAGTGTWEVERTPNNGLRITGPRVDVGTMRDVLADEVVRLAGELAEARELLSCQASPGERSEDPAITAFRRALTRAVLES